MTYSEQDVQKSTQLLCDMKSQFQLMSYQLYRLVNSPEERQISLKIEETQTIDVCSQTHMFFKINVDNREPPGFVQLKYGHDQYFFSFDSPLKISNP